MVNPPKTPRKKAKAAPKRAPRKAPSETRADSDPAAAQAADAAGRAAQVRYSPEIAERICLGLMEGRALKALCREPDMPAPSTVFRWLRERDDFRDQYAHAREVQAELGVDELYEIADDGSNDWIAREKGGYQLNTEALQRSALRIDVRKWAAVKLLPKKYGDRATLDVTHTIANMDDAELANETETLLRKAGLVPPTPKPAH